MVEDYVYQCRGRCAFFFRLRWNLEQSLPARVRWKNKRGLVLHNRFQNVSQSLGLVSIFKTSAGAVKRVRRHPITDKPEANDIGLRDRQTLRLSSVPSAAKPHSM
jgi:hypothetical protein